MDNYGELLSAPFADADIEWRLQHNNDERNSGLAVPYVTNRAIPYRLDEVVGIENWKNEFIPWHSDGRKNSQICGISIWSEERKEWVTKYDGAEDSEIESVKGGLSDSMKRAAVQWGIGRYLYGMDAVWVDTEKRGKTAYIKASEQNKLDKAHQTHVSKCFKKAPASSAALAPRPEQRPEPQESQSQQNIGEPPVRFTYDKPEQSGKEKPQRQSGNNHLVLEIQPIVSPAGTNSHIRLRDNGGKEVIAFLRGTDTALGIGVYLTDVKLSSKIREGVAFNILESYEIFEQAAA